MFISVAGFGFNVKRIINEKVSTNGKFSAYAIQNDNGAPGGDTTVYVKNQKRDIKLLLGTITAREQKIWYGGFRDNLPMSWVDDESIIIDGVTINIKNTNNRSYLLHVYIPSRMPDYTEDTHGGFNGDGDRLEKYFLSSTEKEEIVKNITQSGAWSEITPENKLYLYCGAENVWYNGFLQDYVPETDNGYFAFYNKQMKDTEFPLLGKQYSYNYIIAVYSENENVLYVYEFDS